jgi:hypothetical protein
MVYVFLEVAVFIGNLAKREIVPVLHRTIASKPGIVGFDDQLHNVAFLTVAVNLDEAPDALTILLAAPASVAATLPRTSTTLATPTAILCFIWAP